MRCCPNTERWLNVSPDTLTTFLPVLTSVDTTFTSGLRDNTSTLAITFYFPGGAFPLGGPSPQLRRLTMTTEQRDWQFLAGRLLANYFGPTLNDTSLCAAV